MDHYAVGFLDDPRSWTGQRRILLPSHTQRLLLVMPFTIICITFIIHHNGAIDQDCGTEGVLLEPFISGPLVLVVTLYCCFTSTVCAVLFREIGGHWIVRCAARGMKMGGGAPHRGLGQRAGIIFKHVPPPKMVASPNRLSLSPS